MGAEMGLRGPTGLALGGDGKAWVADHGNGALRRIERFGASTTFASPGVAGPLLSPEHPTEQ